MFSRIRAGLCGNCDKYNYVYGRIERAINSLNTDFYLYRFLKTEAVDPKVIEDASLVVDEETESGLKEYEDEIEKKRNKSRLSESHRNLLHNEVPYPESKAWFHDTVKYRRKIYGKFGHKSGVNPAIMWATGEELAEILEYESITKPYTLQQMMAMNAQKQAEKESTRQIREEDLLKKMAKLEQWKQELNARVSKKLADAQAAKDKKDRLVEEVRRHFGFKVDPRDERFKEMLEKKEKEQKKSAKEAKRKAREAKMMESLTEPKPQQESVNV